MSIPYSAAQLVAAVNQNSWNLQAYNVAKGVQLNDDLQSITDFATFTSFEKANYNTAIEMTSLDVATNSYKGPVRCERIMGGVITSSTEKIVLDNEYLFDAPYCEENVKRTILGVPTTLAEIDRELEMNMREALNKDAYALALASTSLTVPAVTNAATAKAALRTVAAKYRKYKGSFAITAHIPADLMEHFEDIIGASTYKLNDDFLVTGEIGIAFGINLKTIDDSILDVADQGKVLFTVGKPVTFYYDESMFKFESHPAPFGDAKAYKTSNMVRDIRTVGQFVMWDKNQKYLAQAA